MHWLAWQGWRLPVPRDWNVVRIEGDWARGMILLADLKRPRMGLRWDSLPAGGDAEAAVKSAMAAEIGSPASGPANRAAASPGWSFAMQSVEPDPPGRDVWIGHSTVSGRIAQLSFPVEARRDRAARELPDNLADTAESDETAWSILDLSCAAPAGWKLASHHLMAGDLRLTFARETDRLLIRQIAPARLALSRQSIQKWIAQHPLERRRTDRSFGEPTSITTQIHGRTDVGLRQAWTRGGRGLWRMLRGELRRVEVTLLHDAEHDRLWVIESPDPVPSSVINALGWADLVNPEAPR
jgi:hypothetical protein